MRILFLGFNVGYMNPTRALLLDVLRRVGQVTTFGPGFVTLHEVEAGVSQYVAAHGSFDFIVSDEYVLQQFDEANPQTIRFVNHACKFDRSLLIKAIEYRDYMRRAATRRIVTLLQTDYYNVPEPFIGRLDEVADYILGWGPELIAPRQTGPNATVPAASLDAHILTRWTDRYLTYARRNIGRIISIPHIVDQDEFCARPLAERRFDWTVVGADYDSRLRAREALDAARLGRAGRWLPYVFAGFGKLKVNPYAHYWSIALLQLLFRSVLRRARFGYTCGSSARLAIRKYLEIPAAGCVLVADWCQGFGDLGFVDRVNAVLSPGNDVMDVHHWLTADLDAAQAIADAGRRMVAERHSVQARAGQISAALQAILADEFAGSRWSAGDFVIARRGGMPAPVV